MPNTKFNVGFISAATVLVGLGVNTISTDLIVGAVEILLGVLLFTVYELIP